MSRVCTVCAHPDRSEIDRRLSVQVVNVSQTARDFGLTKQAVTRHRARHLPEFLPAFIRSMQALTLGELQAESARLYLTTLDAIGAAQAGVLSHVDEDGKEHRVVSPTAINGLLRTAQKGIDQLARLAADAAGENERPAGVAQGELSARIAEQLARLTTAHTAQHIDAAHSADGVVDDAVTIPSELRAPDGTAGGTAGGLAVEDGGTSPHEVPLDAVMAQKSELIPAEVLHVVALDRLSTELDSKHVNSNVVGYRRNPDCPLSQAASDDERRAAGWPDIEVTVDDLKSDPGLATTMIPLPPR